MLLSVLLRTKTLRKGIHAGFIYIKIGQATVIKIVYVVIA